MNRPDHPPAAREGFDFGDILWRHQTVKLNCVNANLVREVQHFTCGF
jgi:hypothetical protein